MYYRSYRLIEKNTSKYQMNEFKLKKFTNKLSIFWVFEINEFRFHSKYFYFEKIVNLLRYFKTNLYP